VRDVRHGGGDERQVRAISAEALEVHVACERADAHGVLRDLDAGERGDSVDVDQDFRGSDAEGFSIGTRLWPPARHARFVPVFVGRAIASAIDAGRA